MITVTRWVDEKTTNLADIEKLLDSPHPDEIPESGTKYINWEINKVFDKDKRDVFYGREITYNYYTFSVDQIPGGEEITDDGTYTKRGFVIPYFSSGKVRYIISKNTYAQTLLRKMLFYSGRREIFSNTLELSGDLFVWLISKVYGKENTISSENEELSDLIIDSIKGFKGDTEDLLAKVSMSGESVMNIISALSFLIESRNLNQITIALSYRNHLNIEISLNNKNTIGFDEDKYLGELVQVPRHEMIATCFLSLYMEIVPILLQKYQSDIDLNLWGQGKCVSFLEMVADDLNNKVKMRIEDLIAKPEQLKFKMDSKEGFLEVP